MKVAAWLPTDPLLQHVCRIKCAHTAMLVTCESERLTFECTLQYLKALQVWSKSATATSAVMDFV